MYFLVTRSFRLRQDRHLSVPVQVLELRHHRLRRLRRTRQRDVRSPARFPRIDGRRRREDRVHHGPHDPRGQHLQHAGRRSRGLHLHRHHVVRILSRYGLQRFHDGGLHFSLGRSLERNFRQVGWNAGRFGISSLPRCQACVVLRAGRTGQVSREPWEGRVRFYRGSCFATRLNFMLILQKKSFVALLLIVINLHLLGKL